MLTNRTPALLAALALLGCTLIGCGSDDLEPSTSESTAALDGQGTLRVVIHDKPTVEVDEVWLTFDGVSAHHAERGWLEVSDDDVRLELLSLRDGLVEELGLATLPVGHYDQVRLDLIDASVVVDGEVFPLDVPSGMTSGVKIVTDFTLEDCNEVILDLDWDADAHLIHNKQGYKLRPTIKVDALHRDAVCTNRCDGALRFADTQLERAVRDVVEVYDRPLYSADVDTLTSLYVDALALRSLDGVQCLDNLQVLSAADNQISDLRPVAELDHLHTLNLDNNLVVDLSPLTDGARALEALYLYANKVTDARPIARRCDLTTVDLRANALTCTDTTPLRLTECGVTVESTCY